jgi:enoyl-CoA hydratase/carnithine racemase
MRDSPIMPDTPMLTDAALSLEGRIAWLTLRRDDVRNALTGTALIDDVEITARWVNRHEDVSVLVITGAGRAFSAGGDIKDMAARGGDFAGPAAEVAERYRHGIQRIPLALDAVEVPVIAAVNGPAVGAGCDLAAMADIRIAADGAFFAESFLNLGIIPGDGGAWFLQRAIGYQQAAEWTFTGRRVSASDAKQAGFVLSVVPNDALEEEVRALAQQIAAQPPKALRLTKRLMKTARRLELPDFLALSACFQGFCHNEPEHLEAVTAMLDKLKR